MIITKINVVKFNIDIDAVVYHLGINPMKGGSPPIDRRLIVNINLLDFLFRGGLNIWVILLIFKILNIDISIMFIIE